MFLFDMRMMSVVNLMVGMLCEKPIPVNVSPGYCRGNLKREGAANVKTES
jgi:hypothetical protein